MLLDYDVTSNYGNWQYQAGVGVDPRSARQFNIIKQGKDYDAKGEYVAHWLPELAEVYKKHDVPLGLIHHPWTIEALQQPLKANKALNMYAHPQFEQKSWHSHYKRDTHKDSHQQNGSNGKHNNHSRNHNQNRHQSGQAKKEQAKAGPGQDTVEGR